MTEYAQKGGGEVESVYICDLPALRLSELCLLLCVGLAFTIKNVSFDLSQEKQNEYK